ncbi:hypothetical protein FRX31_003037 [Thalictrum thalictroides]|uniref:Uncharacterized protein n=1 Tax=Thalictrum thalictroides TaxID=46969 RepID=A0A7J6XED1_THATH|nr:hypothetical protein FRX31_003037 [Thalictrum thalictroides]
MVDSGLPTLPSLATTAIQNKGKKVQTSVPTSPFVDPFAHSTNQFAPLHTSATGDTPSGSPYQEPISANQLAAFQHFLKLNNDHLQTVVDQDPYLNGGDDDVQVLNKLSIPPNRRVDNQKGICGKHPSFTYHSPRDAFQGNANSTVSPIPDMNQLHNLFQLFQSVSNHDQKMNIPEFASDLDPDAFLD